MGSDNTRRLELAVEGVEHALGELREAITLLLAERSHESPEPSS